MSNLKTGVELIANERREQIEKHSLEWDKFYNDQGQLIDAVDILIGGNGPTPVGWDVDSFRKMIGKPYKDRLIIAGALIAAEIDRIAEE
jgi:hypothetical protein